MAHECIHSYVSILFYPYYFHSMVICDAGNDLGSEGFLGGTDYTVPLFCFWRNYQ